MHDAKKIGRSPTTSRSSRPNHTTAELQREPAGAPLNLAALQRTIGNRQVQQLI